MQAPEIDLAQTAQQVIPALRQACISHGFFYLRNHGIPTEDVQALLTNTAQFFSQPLMDKKRLQRSDTNPWGFYDNELTKNRKDWKEILDIGPDAGSSADPQEPFPEAKAQIPAQPTSFRPQVERYMATCASVSEHLRRLLLQSLDAAEQDVSFDKNHSSFLRLNYYPLCPNPAPSDADFTPSSGELGISHHTDAGVLTLLLQGDVPGLQFYHAGQWHTVPPKPDTLMVNIGDVVQVWSNDRYVAPLHRVLASASQKRYSAAYFYNPSYADRYAPLPSTGQPRYRPISWAEFRQGRTAGDYADVGEELQISHFKI